ncbi:hypothetical protein [Paenibacillus vini]|uniref:DUF4367 domain-containing protein n=1 Tax=Paenibacillus vini TaxID=1476024 RepID=A0ABQ4MC86_9BACL|nr:hypothetical protein [Paenibacillus vini]GIP53601.1 hypothetical protein J42TS3_26360 [Paenibacillus vini]
MNIYKKIRSLFLITFFIFIVFFITVTSIENIFQEQKVLLFVNGPMSLSTEEIKKIKVDGISNGIWDEEQNEFKTNQTYILMKMKSREVILSTNDIEEIINYTNK